MSRHHGFGGTMGKKAQLQHAPWRDGKPAKRPPLPAGNGGGSPVRLAHSLLRLSWKCPCTRQCGYSEPIAATVDRCPHCGADSSGRGCQPGKFSALNSNGGTVQTPPTPPVPPPAVDGEVAGKKKRNRGKKKAAGGEVGAAALSSPTAASFWGLRPPTPTR